MKAFEFTSPATVEEAVKQLAPSDDPNVDPDLYPRPLAGGQDLLTTMKEYITQPPRVVNLKQIPNLDKIESDGKGGFKIGALVTLATLEEHPEVAKNFPGLAEAAHAVATPQIRNLGTIGGNLCQRPRCWYYRLEHVVCLKKGGSECYAKSGENKYNAILGGGPSYIVHPSDLAPMLVALDASVTVMGPQGSGEIPLGKFFTLPRENVRRENVLANDQIITHVNVPASAFGAKSTYLKFRERESLDFAMAACAAAVELDGQNVKQARIVLGGVAPIPWRVPKAEAMMVGKPFSPELAAEVAKSALDGAKPLDKNEYKIPLTQTLVRRALAKVCGAEQAQV
ncbi:MAG TPA: xanthine dehydrogenase family protein subunit M [Tepidisphaeraceae bacterium]|nr:xanthine dehydrogenase family protein subunit M [Tepidisphaeraceae bacterium]